MPVNSRETKIDYDTYIRDLPFSTQRYLSSLLDPDQLWKKFVIHVPKKVDSPNFQERYSSMQVKLFEERGNKNNGSSTKYIIDDWGTQNSRVKHLLKALTEAELYAAADYLSVKILRQDPVQRKTSATSFSSHSDSLPYPPSFSPTQNIDSVDEKKFNKDKDISELTGQSLPQSSVDDVVYHRIQSYDVYPSNDAMAELSPNLTIKHKNTDNYTKENKDNLPVIQPQTKTQEFSYKALCLITNDFDGRNLEEGGRVIGSGGFGKVYLGLPANNYKVAIKALKFDEDAKPDAQYEAMMTKQFQTELETLCEYRHENIVPFLGFSVDGYQKCLVYQYMPNGSLEDPLYCLHNTDPLLWQQRVKISHGTAEGIVYLNTNKLVHRNIKSANILLDKNFSPKVGDFATVRLAPSGTGFSSAVSTKLVIGTSAYMAPEAPRFDISAKLDSFAFGVVLLELLTGLPPLDEQRSECDLLSYILENCDDTDITKYLDMKAGSWDIDIANSMYEVSRQCYENKKKDRVLVSEILPVLQKLVNKI
ncbi:IRAK4 [Mytilus edulis]|uniref:non-specific serine/threonine protein kinase n=1 Tax=Mytilus edulis TaxID=6550 RepID=A0A8S3VBK5_MYTED|nr:IRAK4 [Mytilus edulis]